MNTEPLKQRIDFYAMVSGQIALKSVTPLKSKESNKLYLKVNYYDDSLNDKLTTDIELYENDKWVKINENWSAQDYKDFNLKTLKIKLKTSHVKTV